MRSRPPRLVPPVAGRFARESRTGAAAKRFGVVTAAAGTGPSEATTSARSGLPEALIPAVAPAAANPAGIRADALDRGSVGGERLEQGIGRQGHRVGASGWERVGRDGQGASGSWSRPAGSGSP